MTTYVDLTLRFPLPTVRLASILETTLSVDKEVSTHVQRRITRVENVVEIAYRADENRWLRVAVNGAMENVRSILETMEVLDVDVLEGPQ